MRQLHVFLAQPAYYAQAVQPRHMHIQENQFRLQFQDQVHGFQTVGTSCNYFNFREIFE